MNKQDLFILIATIILLSLIIGLIICLTKKSKYIATPKKGCSKAPKTSLNGAHVQAPPDDICTVPNPGDYKDMIAYAKNATPGNFIVTGNVIKMGNVPKVTIEEKEGKIVLAKGDTLFIKSGSTLIINTHIYNGGMIQVEGTLIIMNPNPPAMSCSIGGRPWKAEYCSNQPIDDSADRVCKDPSTEECSPCTCQNPTTTREECGQYGVCANGTSPYNKPRGGPGILCNWGQVEVVNKGKLEIYGQFYNQNDHALTLVTLTSYLHIYDGGLLSNSGRIDNKAGSETLTEWDPLGEPNITIYDGGILNNNHASNSEFSPGVINNYNHLGSEENTGPNVPPFQGGLIYIQNGGKLNNSGYIQCAPPRAVRSGDDGFDMVSGKIFGTITNIGPDAMCTSINCFNKKDCKSSENRFWCSSTQGCYPIAKYASYFGLIPVGSDYCGGP